MSHPTLKATPARNESWENEGGSVVPVELAEKLGITRSMTETYSVGGYRYTNLADAVAQAHRINQIGQQVGRTPSDA